MNPLISLLLITGHKYCFKVENKSRMALIGEVIKKAIDITGFVSSDPDPVKAQKLVLRQLLKKQNLPHSG